MQAIVALTLLVVAFTGCTSQHIGYATQHTYSVLVVDTRGRPVPQALVRLATVRPWPSGTEKAYAEQGQTDNHGRYDTTTDVVIDRILADSPDLKRSGYVDYPPYSGDVTVVIR